MISSVLPAKEEAQISARPEDSLTARPDNASYIVLRLGDTGAFLRWLLSEENINVFMPLILKSKDSSDIIGAIEFARAFASNTPLKSAAILVGKNKDKDAEQFFQMALTVDPSVSPLLKKVSDGTADDSDFTKLLMGNDNPISSIVQTMLKAEKLGDGTYRLDNELFVRVHDGLILASTSEKDLAASVKALSDSDARLFSRVARKFAAEDFVFAHTDYDTIDAMDTENSLGDADEVAAKYLEKPLDFEMAFESLPEKFVLSIAVNFVDALKKEYSDKLREAHKNIPPVKGGNIELYGGKEPLFALGGYIDMSRLKDDKQGKDLWNEMTRQLRVRFGITEQEFSGLFNGAFSLSVNDSVTFEGFKIPAVYYTQKGAGDSAAKVFERLAKSPHLQKVQDGILQVDSSLSPISCLVRDMGGKLGLFFAELASLSGKPAIKPALQELLDTESVLSMWLDFGALQSWINDDENGVMSLLPMAKMMGFGEIADAVRDVLGAELSVPSVSFSATTPEIFRVEFANKKIDPANGIIAKIVNAYVKFAK